MPSLTQVIKMDVESEALRCERQAEYGYDTVQLELPAVISVGDAINEPRYPSLKAIMGAKRKPLTPSPPATSDRRRRRSAARIRLRSGSPRRRRRRRPPGGSSTTRTPPRRSKRSSPGSTSGGSSRRLTRPGDILVYARTTTARSTRSRSAPSPRREARPRAGGEAHGSARRERPQGWPPRSAASARRGLVAEGPEGLAQPLVDVIARRSPRAASRYVLFGGGLLGFDIAAGLAARLDAGSRWRSPRSAGRAASCRQRPMLGDSASRRSIPLEVGIISAVSTPSRSSSRRRRRAGGAAPSS